VRRASQDVAEAGPYRCRLVNMRLRATPLTKKKGANGSPNGLPGASGTSRTSGCGQLLSGQSGGNLLIDGITMTGGTGGDGGDGTSSSSTPSVGGAGGEPGALNLVSDGDIDIQGNVTLNLGNGGRGGDATSTNNAAGGNATATGGKGGNLKPKNFSSPVTISSKRGIISLFGSLTVNFGTGGTGGTARANGGTGAPGNPGQKGGDATANGGNGGDSEPWSLNASGSVLIFGTINVNGGAGGAGGPNFPRPGDGGPGNAPAAAGGAGGNAAGRAGAGGRGNPPNAVANVPPALAASVLTSPGGAGGSATYAGGKGGDGIPACPATGGAGGKGGDASGGGGDRGNGTPAGAIATVTFNSFGNGGNGKAGNGAAGLGGTNATSLGSGASGVPPAPGSFQPGQPGAPCPPTSVIMDLTQSTPALTPGAVAAGTYVVKVVDAATNAVVGTTNLIAQGAAGTTFYGTGPSRIGWNSTSGSWLIDRNATILGALWIYNVMTVCILNSALSTNNPVFLEQLDALNQVVATLIITQLICSNVALVPTARWLRIRGGMGFADANGFRGDGLPAATSIRRP